MARIRKLGTFDAKLREMAAHLGKANTVRVGFLEGATYPDGTSVATVAAVQEFGSPANNIPPRPFFRSMIAAKSPRWGDGVATVLKANGYDADRALHQVGDAIKGQLQQSIVDTNSPPLAPATIAAKSKGGTSAASLGVLGPAKPLVDTGHMLNSVDYEVS